MNSPNLPHLEPLTQDFIEHLKFKGKSPNTIKNYKTDLDCFKDFLVKRGQGLHLVDFGLPKVLEYGAYLDQKYSSDNSRRRRVQTVRIFFDFLIEKQIFNENPMRKLPTSPKFLDVPKPTPFIDIRKLWDHLTHEVETTKNLEQLIALRNKVVIALIYGGGLKVSDLAAMTMDQLYLMEAGARVLVTPPKRDPYTIPLPGEYLELFNTYLATLKVYKEKQGIEFAYLLFNANPYRILSGGLSPRGLEVVFEELRKHLKINLTPKSLRQSCIFKWLQDKNDDVTIKEWMGVTPHYSLKAYQDDVTKNIFSSVF